ncbi:MAG: DNA polymerase III subunit beta [Gammaproteobacteria bacterium]|nr:MAG: DNA polymerase III subunit beta [Gammaproteobacteria bacterium]
MNIEFDREQLLPALQMVVGVVERRQTLPILSNLLLQVEPDTVTLTTTDLEVELTSRFANASGVSQSVTLPAKKLFDICRALPQGAEIRLQVEDGKARLSSGRSRFTLATMSAEDFPNITDFTPTAELTLPSHTLRQLIEDTQFAMAHQDVRYYLNGLLIEIADRTLRCVATDGHRLAMAETALDGQDGLEAIQIILPRKGVTELFRMLPDSDETVNLEFSGNHLRVTLGDQGMTSKLIDGKFPDYTGVIPAAATLRLGVEREPLRHALQRVSILSNEKFRGVRLSLGNDELTVQAHNPEQEEAEESLPVDHQGQEFEIGFNVNYLLDALSAIRTSHVEFVFTNPDSSALLLPVDDVTRKYVIMPMRL